MMKMPVKMDVKFEEENADVFGKLAKFLKVNTQYGTHFWGAVKGIVWRSTGRKFRSGGGSKKWAPLSPITLLTRKHGGAGIMQENGRLMNSVTKKAAGGIAKNTATRLIVGTNLKTKDGVSHPRVLQEGALITVTPKMRLFMRSTHRINLHTEQIRIPARPFLYVSNDMKKDIGKAVHSFVDKIDKGMIK